MPAPHKCQRSTTRRSPLAALVLVALCLPTLVSVAPTPAYDLGDTPERMRTYGENVWAKYPTVFFSPAGQPHGPRHREPSANAWLGAGVTCEMDANRNDCDGTTNIDTTLRNDFNRDLGDDGVTIPNNGVIYLPICDLTQFRYTITGAENPPAPEMYVNAWFDWNRDGDWEDVLTCSLPGTGVYSVPEWAVQNQLITVPNGTSAVFTTPTFRSDHQGDWHLWVRINVAEQPAPTVPGSSLADGRGPDTGYRYGETEDYLGVWSMSGLNFNLR